MKLVRVHALPMRTCHVAYLQQYNAAVYLRDCCSRREEGAGSSPRDQVIRVVPMSAQDVVMQQCDCGPSGSYTRETRVCSHVDRAPKTRETRVCSHVDGAGECHVRRNKESSFVWVQFGLLLCILTRFC